MSGHHHHPREEGGGEACLLGEIARTLAEEPRLEAVALRKKTREISVATLGADAGGRLAGKVRDAIAGSKSHCGDLTPDGACSICHRRPADFGGGGKIVVKQFLGDTLIEKSTCTTSISFWQWVSMRWPRYAPREHRPFEHDAGEWKLMTWLAAGCLIFGLSGWLLDSLHFPSWASLICYLAAYLCGGWDAAGDAWEKVKKFQLDIHFLMLAVAAGAGVVGAWREGALLLFLFSASGAMEHYAMGRTRKEIDSLLNGAPKSAKVIDPDGRDREIPVEELEAGMTVQLMAGDQVPADLRLTKGETACDEANLTGEATPVPKQPGDTVLAGTLNLWGAVQGTVLRPAKESALQRIITLIQDAQGMKAPSQRFTDRFGTGYTWLILGLCTLMFFVWWLLVGLPPLVTTPEQESALYRAMTLLVVCSPCALVLSVPSSILSAIASGARRGILYRGGSAIENLAKVSVVAMDKTGTLTSGNLTLASLDCVAGSGEEFKRVALHFAKLSNHPLSRAIARIGETWGVKEMHSANIEAVMGRGLRGKVDGIDYFMGSRRWMKELDPDFDVALPQVADLAGAEVWVKGPGLLGRLLFEDEIRPESKHTLAELRRSGITTVMLTGDRKSTADQVASHLGVDQVRAELLPEGKVDAIQQLKEGGAVMVAMIGDGVNDAPCIAAADVGVAMGARGSDAALEQAEVVLMNDRLENFLLARRLSVEARQIIHQNIAIALATVVIMAVTTFIYPIPLALGVAAHEGSTVVVVLNSLRLLAVKLRR